MGFYFLKIRTHDSDEKRMLQFSFVESSAFSPTADARKVATSDG